MDKLKKTNQAMESMSFAVSVVASQQAASWLEKQPVPFPSWLPPIVALVIVGCGFYAFRFIFELFFRNMRWLRRLLLGRQFIEGDWYIKFKSDGRPVTVGVTRIELTEDSVRFSGDYFPLEGEEGQGHYWTELAQLDWPKLKYKYSSNQAAEEHSSQGYGEAEFLDGNRRPLKFSGTYYELLEKRVTYFEGWPVRNREEQKNLDNPKTRRKTVREFFSSPPGTDKNTAAQTTHLVATEAFKTAQRPGSRSEQALATP